jgi:gamma-glutamylcyclotransferase (GGCT)/AIG2-like uncharacterized protein YtfP
MPISRADATQLPYFAYGSNLFQNRLRERIKRIPLAERANLRDFRLVFNKLGQNGSLYANIVAAVGSEIWGVIYDCTDDELLLLDNCEGVPIHYTRERVTVVLRNGDERLAYTYIATAQRTTSEGLPTAKYLGFIVNGATEHQLPNDYIESIRKLGTARGAT